jgi:hypothetical protein
MKIPYCKYRCSEGYGPYFEKIELTGKGKEISGGVSKCSVHKLQIQHRFLGIPYAKSWIRRGAVVFLDEETEIEYEFEWKDI